MRDDLIGIHPNFDIEAYHADPCPEPSLSASGIRTLLAETPAHFAARHPKLTQWPDFARPSTDAMDLGSIVHALILGRGAAYTVIDLSQFRNKDGSVAQTFNNAQAKAAKEEAESRGLIVISAGTNVLAQGIAESAMKHLEERYGKWPLGDSEVAMFWQRKTRSGPIWCRGLVDHFSKQHRLIIDIKTTAKSIGQPEDISRKIAYEGGDLQAAWYAEGISTIFPEFAGDVKFLFLYVEVEPPFEPRPVLLTEGWMTRARFRIDRAADDFAKCLRDDSWPGYPVDVLKLSAPAYLEAKWEEEELSCEGAAV